MISADMIILSARFIMKAVLMFGMVLSFMVYGIIVGIAGWMLGMTFRNIAGFVAPLVHVARTAAPVVVRGSRFAMQYVIRPAARAAYRLAVPHVALAVHHITTATAREAAKAELTRTNVGTMANR